MKKHGLIAASLLFAGTVSQAKTGPNPLYDANVHRCASNNRPFTASPGNYADLAVSPWDLFMLHANGGSIERRPISCALELTNTIANTSYTSIDYVQEASYTWGLIATSDATRTVRININVGTGETSELASYPDGVNRMTDIAGIPNAAAPYNKLEIYARVNVPYGTALRHGTYDRSTRQLSWDAATSPGLGPYARGLTTRDGVLVDMVVYTSSRFYRIDQNNGYAHAPEKLTVGGVAYGEHAYSFIGEYDTVGNGAFDFDAGSQKFFVLDNFRSNTVAENQQVLTWLGGASVVF